MAKVTFLTFYIDYSVGVYVLSSILQDAGHDVSVIFFKLPAQAPVGWFKENPTNMEEVNSYGDIIGSNNDVNGWTDHEVSLLVNKILELSPDVLCISSRSTHRRLVLDVLPKVRMHCDVMMIAGGMGPTLDPELYVDLVDYVFIGEAENAIVELISAIENGQPLSDMDNICYKKNGTIVKNKLRLPDVSQFKCQAIPAEVFYIENDKTFDSAKRKAVINTHTYSTFFGRGCIRSCSYCSAGQWYKIYRSQGIKIKRRRNRQIEDIIEELKSVKDKECTFIHFRDEYMSADTETLKRFFYLYEREICIPFWCYLVPEQILAHPELLKMAVDAGFVDTEIGFQSGSDEINRKIFTRYTSNRRIVAYTRLLSQYDINMKYDFIIFNPGETSEDIKTTFKLIQSLPKKRSYLNLCRLYYFPVSPIVRILKEYEHVQYDFDHYYRIALLYLLCFVLPEKEFSSVLNDDRMLASWQRLREFYKKYINDHNIDFSVGTHAVPESITTQRYERILKKEGYGDVVIWGDSDYYKDMSHIFGDVNVRYFIGDEGREECGGLVVWSPEILAEVQEPLPIFVCSKRKQKIKMDILRGYPKYRGRIYV